MATTEGLRERKKRQTRDAIATAAMSLFAERGYDAVTVAEVARAADVSEKTVFNYFPAKEDLVWSNGAERLAELVDAVRNRPPGTSVLEPFRAQTHAFLDRVARDPIDEIVVRPRLLMGSAALRDRLFLYWEQEAAALAPVIAQEAGGADGALAPEVVARTLAWTHRLTFRSAFRRLLAGEDQRRVARELRREADAAYRLLEQGLDGYGR